ncbi:MAG: 3-isopropylmalate dehydratase small subunit [Lachnospiraceae bacterium]|nr:3-isopropylmalate dehydratase small subunit [Lachnospiraceae bacterium]MBQ5598654.1 3-isopropylmalate dehydratase small subunit [Lachnospiraceae bacterium]
MQAKGRVYKYGDNVDTDVIIPARYLNITDGMELAKHCMEDIDKEFIKTVQKGDIMVAQKNFGCGSSREHAPLVIKCAGVSCVIAETFARIFYRNAINIGLPIIECAEAANAIQAGDEVEIDFDSGMIHNITKNENYKGQAFPPFMQKIISAGGLVNYINAEK